MSPILTPLMLKFQSYQIYQNSHQVPLHHYQLIYFYMNSYHVHHLPLHVTLPLLNLYIIYKIFVYTCLLSELPSYSMCLDNYQDFT